MNEDECEMSLLECVLDLSMQFALEAMTVEDQVEAAYLAGLSDAYGRCADWIENKVGL